MALRFNWGRAVFINDGTGKYEHKPVVGHHFEDDFEGTVIQTTAAGVKGWTVKDTGTSTETIVANDPTAPGVVRLALEATNEKQEAGLYKGDALNYNLDCGPVFECIAKVKVLPTSQSELYFGLANAYVEGPISEADAGPTVHAFFCFDGSGALLCFTDDGTTDRNQIATGITVTADDKFRVFRIDCTDPANVLFFVDGVQVASGTVFDMSAGSNVVVQPFLFAHKETSVGLGTLDIDYVHVWQTKRNP